MVARPGTFGPLNVTDTLRLNSGPGSPRLKASLASVSPTTPSNLAIGGLLAFDPLAGSRQRRDPAFVFRPTFLKVL